MKRSRRNPRTIVAACLIGLLIVGAVGYRVSGYWACTSVEKYDIVKDECYFDCDNDQECDRLTKQRDAELDAAFAASKTKVSTDKPSAPKKLADGARYTLQTTDSETKGTVYTVTANGLQPTPTGRDKQLWELTNRLLGSERVRASLLSFEVFDDANNDTGASVWRSNDPNKWHMNINKSYVDDKTDLIRTIVHEYGHIVTLSGSQVASVSDACPRLELSEGCAGNGSYINSYYDTFWKDYGFDQGQASELSEQDAADLYASEPDSFVSEYASSNITEDIAESFADFITKGKPSGSAIKEQKVRFFYGHPALVQLRESIRSAAAKEVL